MRVLHIGCSYSPYPGGGTVRLKKLVENYSEAVTAFLATHTPSQNSGDDRPFAQVLRDPQINSLTARDTLVRFVEDCRPDVVVLHNSRVLLAWVLFYARRFPAVRTICEIHSVRESTRLHAWLNRWLYRRCDGIVVLSQSMKAYLQRALGRGAPHIAVVYSGIERGSIAAAGPAGRHYDPSGVHYVYAGSFHAWQGVLVIAQAASELGPDFWVHHRLSLVGGGPELERVKAILGPELGKLENIYTPGWLTAGELDELLTDSDFLLAPRLRTSATELVVPLKVVESIRHGIPLIASRVGGLTELLDTGVPAGVFVTPDSVASLADRLANPVDEEAYAQLRRRLEEIRLELPRWSHSSRSYEETMEGTLCSERKDR